MSDNIPFEIQEEITKRLPVKSLIQFRSVSKTWKSLIDSTHFIKHYTSQQQHLLVSYCNKQEEKYVSIVDDETFPKRRGFFDCPPLVKMLKYPRIVGESLGLFCWRGSYHQGSDAPIFGREMAVIWNLSIRKAVGVVVPNGSVLGFGVCRKTTDPKIVKIMRINNSSNVTSIPWQVEVFSLSTRAWRSPYSTKLPPKSIYFDDHGLNIDGVFYWLVGFQFNSLIISFDITTEEFGEVNLPDSLAQQHHVHNLLIFKMRESLVVLDYYKKVIWKMEDGVSKSFTKLFTVNVYISIVRGFRKSGEPLIEILNKGLRTSKLVVYDPYSKHMNDDGIDGMWFSRVFPYVETLLLLDEPNLTVYDGWNENTHE